MHNLGEVKDEMQKIQESYSYVPNKSKPQVVCVNDIWAYVLFQGSGVMKSAVRELREEFMEFLSSQGFEVSIGFDTPLGRTRLGKRLKNYLFRDAIYLTSESGGWQSAEDFAKFQKNLNKKIDLCCGSDLNRPKTITVDEFLRKPFQGSFVFKDESANRGEGKLLIETPQQFEIFKKFHSDFIKKDPHFFDTIVFQQFIETPTDNFTSLRVVMSSSGDVMVANLKHSGGTTKKAKPEGRFGRFLCDPESEYFLNCRSIISNPMPGGRGECEIIFGKNQYRSEERKMLKAHGFDPKNPKLPDSLVRVAAAIAKNCNRELGVTCGIDFILNTNDSKWYFLEANSNPDVKDYAETKGITNPSALDTFKLDIASKYEALVMYMIERTKQRENLNQNAPHKEVAKKSAQPFK